MARVSLSERFLDAHIEGPLLKNGHYGHLGLHVIKEEEDRERGLDECDTISTAESIAVNPSNSSSFIIEEEDSSDDFPAIGHLDSFEIRSAEDGSLLPSTVNAKMADGSQQRLTLYPQIVDGNVTFTIQFENEPQEKQALTQDAILNKIDQLILQNDGIVNGKRNRHRTASLSLKTPFRPHILPAPKKLPMVKAPLQLTPQARKLVSQAEKRKRGSVIQHSQLKSAKPISVLKRPRIQQTLPNKVMAPVTKEVEVRPSLNAMLSDQSLRQRLLSYGTMTTAPKIVKITGNVEVKPAKTPIKIAANNLQSKRKESVVPVPTIAATPPVREDKKIFLQSRPVSIKPSNKAAPLGSRSNPITLIQDGQNYESQHPLTEAQIEQITRILKKHSDNLSSNEDNVVVDPETKSRILYKVIYPQENLVENREKPKELKLTVPPKVNRLRKIVKLAAEKKEKCKENVDPPLSAETAITAEEEAIDPPMTPVARPLKLVQLSRTRSGRLSRPPQHMVKDYKRIEAGPEATAKKDVSLMDYEVAAEEPPPPPPSATPAVPLNQYIKHRNLKSWNVKADYRCPTCKKVYLGHNRMMLHLRKFPHHSNLTEYTRHFNQPRPAKPLKNKRKMIRMVSRMERAAFGPLLAKAFNSWEFMLLRIGLIEKDGTNEVELIFSELNALIERMRAICEEMLVPVYGNESGESVKDDLCVHLDKVELAYALGLTQGSYKVNKDLLHLLRLEETAPPEEPKDIPCPPPPPKTPELATKFEPNLSTKLMECSNDSIDLDCSSKDIDIEEEKKEWVPERAEDTSTEFLSEFLENGLPSGSEPLTLWKELKIKTPAVGAADPWKKNVPRRGEQPEMWKDGESPFAANNGDLWKRTKAGKGWTEAQPQQNWKRSHNVWESDDIAPTREHNKGEEPTIWNKDANSSREIEPWNKTDKWEGSGLPIRAWKEDGVAPPPVPGMPGLRASRLTSTPETASALFCPPLRRNSVSGFVPAHQEELLSLDLHELFDDLIPEPTKEDPKPGSIESIINEALFHDNEPSSHTDIPHINDTLDEFGFS